jgi:hypothetical protein
MEWYAGRNGESFGPFAFERLIEGAQSGELQRTDLVWRTGMDAWVSASTIPELWQQKIIDQSIKERLVAPGHSGCGIGDAVVDTVLVPADALFLYRVAEAALIA